MEHNPETDIINPEEASRNELVEFLASRVTINDPEVLDSLKKDLKLVSLAQYSREIESWHRYQLTDKADKQTSVTIGDRIFADSNSREVSAVARELQSRTIKKAEEEKWSAGDIGRLQNKEWGINHWIDFLVKKEDGSLVFDGNNFGSYFAPHESEYMQESYEKMVGRKGAEFLARIEKVYPRLYGRICYLEAEYEKKHRLVETALSSADEDRQGENVDNHMNAFDVAAHSLSVWLEANKEEFDALLAKAYILMRLMGALPGFLRA